MKKINIKYIVSALITIGMFIEVVAVYKVYGYFSLMRVANPISSELFFTIVAGVLLIPVIYIIAYLVSLILINKNKTIGYLISGVVALLSFSDSISELVKNNIHYTWGMVPSTLVFTLIIVLSFWARAKLEENK